MLVNNIVQYVMLDHVNQQDGGVPCRAQCYYTSADGTVAAASPSWVGVKTQNSDNEPIVYEGEEVPIVKLAPHSQRCGYFVPSNKNLCLGYRQLVKSFRWGMSSDNYEFLTVRQLVGSSTKTKDFALVKEVKPVDMKPYYTVVNENIVAYENNVYILNIKVGFLEGNVCKVRNRATARVLEEANTGWTIVCW